MTRAPALVGFLLAVLLGLPAPGSAQELGLSFTRAKSDHPELPGPQGFAAHARLPVAPGWDFRVAFHRVTDETDKIGQVCRFYAPHIGCTYENTRTSLSFTSIRLGVSRPFSLTERGRFSIGAGGSFNLLGGDSHGESGLRADLLIPKGGQIGAFGALFLALTPFPAFPVSVEGGIHYHWVKFSLCSGEHPPQYDPFCTPDSFREVEVGLSFPIR